MPVLLLKYHSITLYKVGVISKVNKLLAMKSRNYKKHLKATEFSGRMRTAIIQKRCFERPQIKLFLYFLSQCRFLFM